MTDQTHHFDMMQAPLRIGAVRLNVRDLDAVSAFYRDILGLRPLATDAQGVTLGAQDTPLLHLHGDPALRPADRREAGLFHTAFLLPSRADLARWLVHAAGRGVRLQGASDHLVSEAIYLADPEGNGIEVYADRPVGGWRDASGEIRMTTAPLDLQELATDATGTRWDGFPADGTVGHVHLQVGDTAAADGFYRDVLGFDIAALYPGASFYGSGGYHHQLAGNAWNSRRAGQRSPDTAGLAEVELVLRDAADLAAIAARAERAGTPHETTATGAILRDPWGTAIALRP